jgi:glutaredoxin
MSSQRPHARFGMAARLIALSALLLCAPVHALYKIVGPDGKVTYTDRLPSPADGRVTPLNAAGAGAGDAATLPLELRQVAARYPVTLYVIADCAPCDSARALLRQRGVPYVEKIVQSGEDAEALQRLAGSRDAPTLMIGQQPLRGLSADTWNAYLDAAGYPRESRLPAGYQFPAATPLTERREPAPAASAPSITRTPAAPAAAEAAAPATPGIRF